MEIRREGRLGEFAGAGTPPGDIEDLQDRWQVPAAGASARHGAAGGDVVGERIVGGWVRHI